VTGALAAAFLLAAGPGQSATVHLDAAGSGSVYETIEASLGRGVIESPDRFHPSFGPHITRTVDRTLRKPVFVFHLHVNEDGDPDGPTDKTRQRNEIKVFDLSPDGLKGFNGTTFVYEWKFRLARGLKVTKQWTHFFQLKPFGGTDDGMPVITISARKMGERELIEIRYCVGAPDKNAYRYVAEHPLADAKGVWLSARCRVTWGETGSIDMTVAKLDGTVVVAYRASPIRMWRDGCEFVRPKWGIYRGMAPGLRDEKVRFADFTITKE